MSLVKFLNIKNFEVNLDKHCKISVEYVVDKGVNVTHSDWIAIYPHGANVWHTVNIELMAAYEFVVIGPVRKDERRYNLEFSLAGAKKLKYGQKYQFVYFSRFSEIYGISNTFEFRPPALNVLSDYSNVSQESDDTSKENIPEEKTLLDNNKKRKAKRRTQQLLLRPKVESDKSESDDHGGSGDQNSRDAKNFINKFKKNKQVFMNKQVETSPNNNCGFYQMSPPISCSNCHRVAGLLRAQEHLYNKIKNLAEINSDLRSQVGHLQRRVELSQAACQKLSVTLMRERQAKQFYQAAAYQQAEYEYQIMLVEPFVPNVLVPTTREPQTPGRIRTEDKTRGWSVLKLKAIIGNQEEKIRNLTKEIAQLKMDKTQRVAAIVRDIEVNHVVEEHFAKDNRELIKEEALSDEN